MIPRPVWEAAYERGIVAVNAGEWDEALKAFDETYELSGRLQSILRSRSEVLDLLASVESARAANLGTTQTSVARLFKLLSSLPPPVRDVILFPGHSNELPTQAWAIQRAEDIRSSLLESRNLIDFLPPEILTAIGRLSVEDAGSSDVAFTLAAVCQRWRAVFLADLQLWEPVQLGGKTMQAALAKLDICLAQRPVRRVVVKYATSYAEDQFFASLDGRAQDIQSLVLRSPTVRLHTVLRCLGTFQSLKELVIYRPDRCAARNSANAQLLPSRPLPRIRRLVIRSTKSLKDAAEDLVSVAWALPFLPNLEELVVDHPEYTLYPSSSSPTTVAAPALETLDLSRGACLPTVENVHPVFLLPNLRVLDLSGSSAESYIPYLFPPDHPPNTDHLTHLLLPDSEPDEQTLIGHLPDLGALTHLDIRGTLAPHKLVQALVSPAKDELAKPLCPMLKRLHLNAQHFEDWIENNIKVRIDTSSLSSLSLSEDARQMALSRPRSALQVVGWYGRRVGFQWDYASAVEWENKQSADRLTWMAGEPTAGPMGKDGVEEQVASAVEAGNETVGATATSSADAGGVPSRINSTKHRHRFRFTLRQIVRFAFPSFLTPTSSS